MSTNGKTVACRICSTQTNQLGTQLCNRCWEMERGFGSLQTRNESAAKTWILSKLKEMGLGKEER